MITKSGIIYGLGDAINARAFLLTYCKQKNIEPKDITIYSDKYWFLFKNDGFKRELDRKKMRGLIGYKNFGNYDLPKTFDTDKCDLCIATNADLKDFSFDTIVPLNFDESEKNIDHITLPRKFITINNGYGKFSGDPEDYNMVCTKAWENSYWDELVLKIGIPCVQIGAGNSCKPIKGTVLNLLDKTTIPQTAEIMKRALFHLDIEGGLVILGQHSGVKSVVLFGATAIENQGRSFNLNISANVCEPCYEWGQHKYSLKENIHNLKCKRKCMKELKPDYVINRIYEEKWL